MINLTPHVIRVVNADGSIKEIASSGAVVRITVRNIPAGQIGGIDIFTQETGHVIGLPEATEGETFIVSLAVRQAVPGRSDVFSPGELVRDDKGQPIGCRGLVANGGGQ